MFDKLKSIYIWLAIAVIFLLWFPLMGILYLFDRDPVKYKTGYFFRKLGAAMTYVNPAWKINIEGNFPENPRNPFVVVSNHLSNADIPVISRLPWEMKWVSKIELFKIPFVGKMMAWAKDISVDRSARGKRDKTLFEAEEILKQKCSVIFFPEGTRSKTGKLMRFTDGAFLLAIKSKIPILPLVIDGTSNALPKHSWIFTGQSNVKLKVCPPISTQNFSLNDVHILRDKVRDILLQQLATWRGVSISEIDTLAEINGN